MNNRSTTELDAKLLAIGIEFGKYKKEKKNQLGEMLNSSILRIRLKIII